MVSDGVVEVTLLGQNVNSYGRGLDNNIIFSKHDEDLIIELERTVYSRTPSGHIVYKTMTERGGKSGDDHNIAALLSFMLSHFYKYEQEGFTMQRKKLWSSRWY